MPTATGRAFTTANLLTNLAALKAINFGGSDPAGTWFVVPNLTTSNVEIWVWQPDSMVTTDEISVVRPDSIVPGSPGRCVQRLKFDPAQLGGILAAIAALTTTGLIERIAGGGVSTATVSSFIKTFLDDIDQSTARTTLGLGAAATRAIGTSTGTVRDAADAAYTNARTPTAHVATHAVGGADALTVFGFLAVTASSTLTAANQRQLINVDATSGVITITLPAAATVGSGWAVQIRKADASANLVTISRSGTDLINGVATLPLAVQHQSFILFSLGGTSWGVVAGFEGTLPANSLLGTGATPGIAGIIPSSTFATPAQVSTAYVNLTTVQTIAGAKTLTSPLTIRGDVGIINLFGNTDNYNTFRFTANINTASSYWDIGVGPSSLNRDFYIGSGYAGGGLGFRLDALNYNLALATTTEATSTTTGGLVLNAGLGLGKNLFAGGKICPVASPAVNWGLDYATGGSTINLVTGGTYDLATGSGMVVIYDDGDGNFNFMFASAGNVISVSSSPSSSIVAGSPPSDKVGLFYNGGTAKYRISNNRATTRTLIISTVKMRAAS